ncbi:hypothetical protein FJY71_10010 [candidate division WOR-3 bacterium]|nr:hypothetical protein [candidate division WOR-3 bacterium]
MAAAIIPTTEQIRRTVSAMEVEGFVRIQVREVMERGWFARQTGLRPADRMVAHTVFVVLGHRTTETGKVEAGTGESESAGAGDSLEG